MAFNTTAQNPTALEVVGSFVTAKWGVTTLAGGVGTVTMPGVAQVLAVFVSAQTTTACSVSATTSNSFSIAGGTTDVIMWMAIVAGGV